MVELWHVRHAQRADEVSGPEKANFKSSTAYREGRYYDTPLTRYGHVQASKAGRFLSSLTFNQPSVRESSGFDRVYCSPLLRAVQTAYCISLQLGGLPLQVVHGLGSCTAAMVRIGYKECITMSDPDILDAFPDINLFPRDPTAPSSFEGACDWLAALTKRIRVLAVGHREGIKGMAGRTVPTPHCCIAIFQAKCKPATTYVMQELLSYEGVSLRRGSVIAFSHHRVGSGAGATENSEKDGEDSLLAGLLEGPLPPNTARANQTRAFLTGDRWLRRAMRTTKAQRDQVRPKPAKTSSRREKQSAGVSMETMTEINPGALTQFPRKLSSNRKDTEHIQRRQRPSAVTGGTSTHGAAATTANPVGSRSKERATASRTAAASSSKANNNHSLNNQQHRRVSASDCGAKGKIAAGGGFRVATLARHSSGRSAAKDPRMASLLGMAPDSLSGPMGVLSFLHAVDLCMVQVACKTLAIAVESDLLWRSVYMRLSQTLRDRTESIVTAAAVGATREATSYKERFVIATIAMWKSRLSSTKRKIAHARRRRGFIYDLRPSVDAVHAGVTVRLSGKSAEIVDSIGTRTEDWVSCWNLLSGPSIRNGIRMFSLSSSVKVALPPAMTASQCANIHVALSAPDLCLVGATLFKTADNPLLFSQARFLVSSRDDSVALYELVSANSFHDRHYRHDDNSDEHGGTVIPFPSLPPVPPPLPCGCALLGLLNDPQQKKEASKQQAGADHGVGFLSIHFPHQLLLDTATRNPTAPKNTTDNITEKGPWRRRSQTYGDDSAAGDYDILKNLSAALGLRTIGVAIWETAAVGVTARLSPRRQHSSTRRHEGNESVLVLPHSQSHSSQNQSVVSVELVSPGATSTEGWAMGAAAGGISRLNAGPRLPFLTSGGLSGVFEDVLLADFHLCDEHGDSLWAFTSPIVFDKVNGDNKSIRDENTTTSLAANEDAGGPAPGTDDVIDMSYSEVRRERRVGVVEEPGVGRVIVELALISSDSAGDGEAHQQQDRAAASRGASCRRSSPPLPGGNKAEWSVRLARVELEFGFYNAWYAN